MGETQTGSGRSGPSFATIVLVALLAAGVIGALVGVVIVRATSSDVAALTLEPANAAGANPFTASVASAGGPANANTQSAINATRASFTKDPDTGALVAPADAPGLYGGSGDTKVCNPQQLIDFLTQDQAKAKAWASVLDISTDDIATYIASLTPVLLTSDTLVTNHGYNNGKATSSQSVLQAGTAVMVDATGTPRVKCNCGNPLTEPQTITLTNAKLTGTAWPGYDINNFTTIHATTQITNLVIINIQTGTTYTQPMPVTPNPTNTNDDETGGGMWVAAQRAGGAQSLTTFATSSDGTTWTDVGRLEGTMVTSLAYANGLWVAIDTAAGSTSTIHTSSDLANWTKVASEGERLTGLAFGDGRWVAVGSKGNAQQKSRVAYTSTDATTWTALSIGGGAGARLQSLESVAFGDGSWTAVGVDATGVTGGQLTTFRSTDGTSWTAGGSPLDIPGVSSGVSVAYHAGTWTLVPEGLPTVYQSTDGFSWTTPTDEPSIETGAVFAVAAGDPGYLAFGGPPTGNGGRTVFSSPDGRSWTSTVGVDWFADALAWGGVGAGTSSGSTDTTVASGPPCTQEALQAGLDISTILRGALIKCNGTWAAIAGVVYNDSGGDEGNALLRADGDAWVSGGSCNDPDIPPDIFQVACTSS